MSESITNLLTRFCEEVVFKDLGPDEYGGANKTLGASHSKQIILPKCLSYYCNQLCFSLIYPSSKSIQTVYCSVLEEGILQPVAAQIPFHGTPQLSSLQSTCECSLLLAGLERTMLYLTFANLHHTKLAMHLNLCKSDILTVSAASPRVLWIVMCWWWSGRQESLDFVLPSAEHSCCWTRKF